jgi:hypothetical protein
LFSRVGTEFSAALICSSVIILLAPLVAVTLRFERDNRLFSGRMLRFSRPASPLETREFEGLPVKSRDVAGH